MTVEERIYSALTGSTELLSLLADGANSIYNGRSDDAGTYPVIVFNLISAVPVFHSDNKLRAFSTVHRITIITADGRVSAIRDLVYRVMTDAGFGWESTDRLQDSDSVITSMDFNYYEEITEE